MLDMKFYLRVLDFLDFIIQQESYIDGSSWNGNKFWSLYVIIVCPLGKKEGLFVIVRLRYNLSYLMDRFSTIKKEYTGSN